MRAPDAMARGTAVEDLRLSQRGGYAIRVTARRYARAIGSRDVRGVVELSVEGVGLSGSDLERAARQLVTDPWVLSGLAASGGRVAVSGSRDRGAVLRDVLADSAAFAGGAAPAKARTLAALGTSRRRRVRSTGSGRRSRVAVSRAVALRTVDAAGHDMAPLAIASELGAVLANFYFRDRSSLRLRIGNGQPGGDPAVEVEELGGPGEARLSQHGLDTLTRAIRARPRLLVALARRAHADGSELRVNLRAGRYVGGLIRL